MIRKNHLLPLRSQLLLLVGLLVAVCLWFAANDFYRNYVRYQEVSQLLERNRVTDDCLQAVKNFAFERGRSSVVLRSPLEISDKNIQFIATKRKAADHFIAATLSDLPASVRHLGRETEQAWLAVQALRPAIDRDVSLPLIDRDPSVPKRWIAAANQLVDSLMNLMIDVSHLHGVQDGHYERLNRMRILALQFRNFSGTESNLLGSELAAGKVPSREVISQVDRVRGSSMLAWAEIERVSEHFNDAQFVSARDRVRAQFYGRFRLLQDAIVAAAANDQRSTVSIEQYTTAAPPALDSIIDLADQFSRANTQYIATQSLISKRQVAVSGMGIMLVLGLGLFSVLLLRRRFSQPLHEISARIDKLLKVQADEAPSVGALLHHTQGKEDELTRVQDALILLDQTMAERIAGEQALHNSERIRASILACAPQSIIATDVHGLITLFSAGSEAMLGYSADEVVGKKTPALIHDHEQICQRAKALSVELDLPIEPGFQVFVAKTTLSGEPDEQEWVYVRKDGTRLNALLSITALRNELGEVDGYLGVATDITERTKSVNEISHLAHFDYLTELPNRRLFQDRLQMAINQARRDRMVMAVFSIDLDRFKSVNDLLGHAVGDLLLTAAAKRIAACVRDSDTLARFGGDEFVVLLPNIAIGNDALAVAKKIVGTLSVPFELDGGYKVSIGGSIGVALYPEHGQDEKRLLKSADDALYEVKESGGNGVRIYHHPVGAQIDQANLALRNGSGIHLTWRTSYESGNATIDDEHRDLFDRANALIAMASSEEPAMEKLNEDLVELIARLVKHFEDEEKVLEGLGYEGRHEHALKHQKLIARTVELRSMVEEGQLMLGDLITYLAQDVVARHILKEDKKFFPLLRQAEKNKAKPFNGKNVA